MVTTAVMAVVPFSRASADQGGGALRLLPGARTHPQRATSCPPTDRCVPPGAKPGSRSASGRANSAVASLWLGPCSGPSRPGYRRPPSILPAARPPPVPMSPVPGPWFRTVVPGLWLPGRGSRAVVAGPWLPGRGSRVRLPAAAAALVSGSQLPGPAAGPAAGSAAGSVAARGFPHSCQPWFRLTFAGVDSSALVLPPGCDPWSPAPATGPSSPPSLLPRSFLKIVGGKCATGGQCH
jgi:hypothetical protein